MGIHSNSPNGPHQPKLILEELNEVQISRMKKILKDDIEVYNWIWERFESYFCRLYPLQDYVEYKASCISSDQRICNNFLAGSEEYIPKVFISDTRSMNYLKGLVITKLKLS